MTREEMLTEVIRVCGFEHKMTIWFAGLMEDSNISNESLECAMIIAVTNAFIEEEED